MYIDTTKTVSIYVPVVNVGVIKRCVLNGVHYLENFARYAENGFGLGFDCTIIQCKEHHGESHRHDREVFPS